MQMCYWKLQIHDMRQKNIEPLTVVDFEEFWSSFGRPISKDVAKDLYDDYLSNSIRAKINEIIDCINALNGGVAE